MNMKQNQLDFHRLVAAGDFKKIKEFYDNGGKAALNQNLTYACGATWIIPLPLVVAFQRGYYDIARLLIEKGADLDAHCRKCNVTPRELMPKDFLQEDAGTHDVVKDFLWKIRDGKLEDVKSFLENAPGTVLNENLVVKGKLYPLPLALAFKRDRKEIASFLIEKGADPDAYCRKYDAYVKDLNVNKRRKGNEK